MIFKHKHFDVQIERNVDANGLSWPKPGEAMNEGNLGGNPFYVDLRYLSWREALRVYELEEKYIKRILASSDPDIEYKKIDGEIESDPVGIFGLDIGVASSVCALFAARCIPFSSCNAGAFGGSHNEDFPCVVFYARMESIDMLLQCAETAEVGLKLIQEVGCLFLYSDDINKMRIFANSLIENRSVFRKLKTRKKKGPSGKQLKLEF